MVAYKRLLTGAHGGGGKGEKGTATMNGGHGEKYARWKVENEAEEVIWYTGQRDGKEKGEKEERGD